MPTIPEARFFLMRERPYLASGIMALTPVETDRLPTLACDKYWRLYYNAEFLASVTMAEAGGLIYHELLHLLNGHHKRFPELSTQESQLKANIAGDLAINPVVIRDAETVRHQEKIKLPKGVVLPPDFGFPDYKTAEEYYNLLENIELPPGGGGDMPGGKNMPQCGSAAGNPGSWEHESPVKSNTPGLTDGQQDMVKRKIANDIKQTCNKNPGTVPASLEILADQIIAKPKVNWRRKLKNYVTNAVDLVSGHDEQSYSRRYRRQHLMGSKKILRPGWVEPKFTVAVVIDTSGSMMGKPLQAATAEVKGILDASSGEIVYYATDTRVAARGRTDNIKKVKLAGGGGTDMGAGIKEAVKDRSDIIIVVTDGYTPWPSEKLGRMPVVACTLGYHEHVPGWVKHVKVALDDA